MKLKKIIFLLGVPTNLWRLAQNMIVFKFNFYVNDSEYACISN